MFCYKDMTFCVNDKCKKTYRRKLTQEITDKANEFGMPLAVSNFFCVDCGDRDETEEMS